MLQSIFLLFLTIFMMVGCDSSESEPLQIDVAKPFSVYKGPLNDAPVPINQKVYLEFSASLDTNTVNETTAYMVDENNNSVGLYIGIGNPDTKIILTPYAFLEPSKSYTIVVTTALQDVNGRSLSEEYRYEFTTQSDSVDSTPLTIRALKPDRDAPTVLVQSEIAIDFSKNLSLEPQYTNLEYLRVLNQAGTQIAGRTEVFNSLLKFIPAQALPYEEYMTVELMHPVSDLFNGSFTDLAAAKWSFTTKSELQSPIVGSGFIPLASTSLAKQSYLVRTIYDDSNGESKIAVATQSGIDIYLVQYGANVQPILIYQYSYPLSSKINAMVSVLGEYLIVGTMNDGIEMFKVLPTNLQTLGNYITGQSVYGLRVGKNVQNIPDKLYAVGPELGLQIFHLDPSGGLIISTNSTVGQALDVVEATEYDSNVGTTVRKIYVADYNGSVVICDENGTLLSRTDLNMSVKKLTFDEDYNGKLSLLAIGSSGKVQGLDFDGSLFSNVKLDLISNIYDVNSYIDFYTLSSNIYFSGGTSGILVTSGDHPNSIVTTSGSVVSTDIVVDSVKSIAYLVALNDDGRLQVFNAYADVSAPYASTTPYNGQIVSANGFSFITTFFDENLDTSTITRESFTFFDLNSSVAVPFVFDISGAEYKLTPLSPLSPNTNYSVTISGNVADLLGNKINAGEDTVVNFQTNSDIALPTLTINDVSVSEDSNITFTISLSEASSTDILFDYDTLGGSATDGVDYTSISGLSGIVAGELNTTIVIEVRDDYIAEGSETFTLNLSNPSANVSIGDSEGLGTITDETVFGAEDTAEVGIFGSSTVNEGNNMSFTLAVSQYAITPLQINLAITHIDTDSSDIETPTVMSVTILATNNNATFTVPTVDDNVSETDESLKVEIISIDSIVNGGYENVVIGGAYSTQRTTIIEDNDGGPQLITLYFNDVQADENSSNMIFTVAREESIGEEVTFYYNTQDINATAGSDYTETSGSGSLSAGDYSTTISVPILNDNDVEGSETFYLNVVDVSANAELTNDKAVGTILDDEPQT